MRRCGRRGGIGKGRRWSVRGNGRRSDQGRRRRAERRKEKVELTASRTGRRRKIGSMGVKTKSFPSIQPYQRTEAEMGSAQNVLLQRSELKLELTADDLFSQEPAPLLLRSHILDLENTCGTVLGSLVRQVHSRETSLGVGETPEATRREGGWRGGRGGG